MVINVDARVSRQAAAQFLVDSALSSSMASCHQLDSPHLLTHGGATLCFPFVSDLVLFFIFQNILYLINKFYIARIENVLVWCMHTLCKDDHHQINTPILYTIYCPRNGLSHIDLIILLSR